MVIIALMTPDARVGGVVIVAVMTRHTLICYSSMRPIQCIVLVVNIKGGRIPVGFCGVTCSTLRRQIEILVIGIYGLIIVRHMTRITIGRRALVS